MCKPCIYHLLCTCVQTSTTCCVAWTHPLNEGPLDRGPLNKGPLNNGPLNKDALIDKPSKHMGVTSRLPHPQHSTAPACRQRPPPAFHGGSRRGRLGQQMSQPAGSTNITTCRVNKCHNLQGQRTSQPAGSTNSTTCRLEEKNNTQLAYTVRRCTLQIWMESAIT